MALQTEIHHTSNDKIHQDTGLASYKLYDILCLYLYTYEITVDKLGDNKTVYITILTIVTIYFKQPNFF